MMRHGLAARILFALLSLTAVSSKPWAKSPSIQCSDSSGCINKRTAALATDSSGNVAFGGAFTGILSNGADQITAAVRNGFTALFDKSGAELWTLAGPFGSKESNINGIGFFSNGNIVVVGTFQGKLTSRQFQG